MPQNSLKTLISAAVLVTLGLPRAALADDDKVTKAAILSREAEKLLADGKTDQACEKYDQSQQFDPRGETLLDLAICREKQGRLGTAYNLFNQADKIAQDEKRTDRSQTAKQHINTLFAKVARLTVTVPATSMTEGLVVTVGDQTVPNDQWGKPFPVDNGDLKITASAPNKATWESVVPGVTPASKKSVSIPALQPGSGPAPKPVIDVPINHGPDNPGNPPPTTGPGTVTPPNTPPPPPEGHRAKRVVVDLQVLAGLHVSAVTRSSNALITGTQYAYNGANQSQYLASCGDDNSVPGAGTCDATFNPQLALLAGGNLFIGWAVTDKLQMGGRVMGGFHYPVGFEVVGGPSLSVKLKGPLFLGATILAGTSAVTATVTGAKGSVPVEFEDANAGGDVTIGPKNLSGGLAGGDKTATNWARFELGGSIEISVVLAEKLSGATGALLLSAWPQALWNPGGGVNFGVPIGFGYRFY